MRVYCGDPGRIGFPTCESIHRFPKTTNGMIDTGNNRNGRLWEKTGPRSRV
jgi:hypothetical protein